MKFQHPSVSRPVLSVAPNKAETSLHPKKGIEDFTEISGTRNNYNSEVVDYDYNRECVKACAQYEQTSDRLDRNGFKKLRRNRLTSMFDQEL